MSSKIFLQKLGFTPKENVSGVFCKNYQVFGNYCIEVNLEKEKFNFGNKIKFECGTTLNFSQEENWVVFECVDRLLEKGYNPEDITLEKTWKTGHGTSGRLDILVEKNKKAFLMIECKTWGAEFEKELKKIEKDGGQLFTYFQQDNKAEYLILYTSYFDGKEINYKNEIIKIEENYREAGNIKDCYDRWNKLTKQNGVFDDWVYAYEFQSKALTRKDLKNIKQEDSGFIFNRFLEILRHNVVSDKPNAFNKIFALFLCKIVDEDRPQEEQLHFQWIEGEDKNILFQKRLADLYKRGMKELLEKEITDIGDEEFEQKFGMVDKKYKTEFLKILTEIRLKKNNEFAFKEVFDDSSFEDNTKVVKEVVELLQGYQLRYNKKHQYLGDFFELLLTTGLKQESGQFFTPVPVAKFIIKSLPIKEIIENKIKKGNPNDLLPFIIDYAAGSGHFLTESMEEIQNIVDKIDESKLSPKASQKIKSWKDDQFNWAFDYVYGIEKDYRLVKTAKVSCYLHGDGLAKIIHGDGLSAFDKASEYREKLKETNHDFPQDNKQFDVVVSNPPYSVSAFKGTINESAEDSKKSFELFNYLTDQSSEIECLFIERMKHLLKDGGYAGIVLPSSILSNTGIYSKTREILFKYFKIIAITELGSGTFMATGTNTVVLFLRRRENNEWENIKNSVEAFFSSYKDITVNGIENIFSKYVKWTWGTISFEDFVLLCKNNPNNKTKKHDTFREYEKKIKAKNDREKQENILAIEKEKLLYFILAYSQKVVIVKSGKKKEEKAFLGYEFSNRRGHEGIHSVQRSKPIDECTKMFDSENPENQEKASFYIYKAFLDEVDLEVDKSMKKNISYAILADMMTFDRVDFEKTISLTLKKTLEVASKRDMVRLGDISIIDWGNTNLTKKIFRENGKYDVFSATGKDGKTDSFEQNGDAIILSAIGARCGKCFWANGKWTAIKNTIIIKAKNDVLLKYLFLLINDEDFWDKNGKGQPFITLDSANNQKIPLPPKEIQEKIIGEMEKIKEKEDGINKEVEKLKKSINDLIPKNTSSEKIENISVFLKRGKSPKYGDSNIQIIKSGQARGYKNFDFTEKYFVDNNFVIDERKLEKGDILINSTGVGTAGRVTLFDLDADCLADSHITILRLDQTKAFPDYVLYYLADIIGFKAIEKMALGQSGQIELALETIKNIKIHLPNLKEQQKIVVKIQEIEDQISKFKKELREIKNKKTDILKKYL